MRQQRQADISRRFRESDMREWGKDDYYSKFTSYSLIKIQIFISEHG